METRIYWIKTQFRNMNTVTINQSLEELHPSLWRASQLGRATTRCVDTGHLALSNQLVGKGWPTGTLIELLVQQPGIGEMRLLAPALAKVAEKKIVMIQPPHVPHAVGLASMGLSPSHFLWLTPKTSSDTLWAAEQVLRSGSCGALMLWANHIRTDSLRRLHLASQSGEALFWILRPLAAAQDASPAPLRLSLRPARGGLDIGFVKRRGPQRDEPLFLPLPEPYAVQHRKVAEIQKRPGVPAVGVLQGDEAIAPG